MVDEQTQHENFEKAAGGPNAAFRLLRIWEGCPRSSNLLYPNPKDAPKHWEVKDKVGIFREKAKREGYTPKAIKLFLEIQGY